MALSLYFIQRFTSVKQIQMIVPKLSFMIQVRGFGFHSGVNKHLNSRGNRPNKHVDPKWKKGRNAKVLKIDFPDEEFSRRLAKKELSPEEMRSRMKEMGVLPHKPYSEIPMVLSSTGTVVDSYQPPEADGNATFLTKEGAKRSMQMFGQKGKNFLAIRTIRSYDEDFDPRFFATEIAHDIYLKAHEALTAKDNETLHKVVTEMAYPEMIFGTERRTMRWSFIKSLEPARVVRVRKMNVIQKSNIFAQVTVRFNTQQTLAVYDRFGRLIHGNELVAKDVLEYVVFEKHLSNLYGTWRLHAKIVPDWLRQRRPSSYLTQVLQTNDVATVESSIIQSEDVIELSRDEVDHNEDGDDSVIHDKFGRVIKN